MNEKALMTLQRVGMEFGRQRVLENIDLTIDRSQTVVVIGESGCGKTVLLKLMIALLRPTTGRVMFDGKVLAGLRGRDLTRGRVRMGFLFQGADLFDRLSVFDNVAFGLREQRGRSDSEIRELVKQRLQEVGLPAGIELK